MTSHAVPESDLQLFKFQAERQQIREEIARQMAKVPDWDREVERKEEARQRLTKQISILEHQERRVVAHIGGPTILEQETGGTYLDWLVQGGTKRILSMVQGSKHWHSRPLLRVEAETPAPSTCRSLEKDLAIAASHLRYAQAVANAYPPSRMSEGKLLVARVSEPPGGQALGSSRQALA